MFLINGNFFDFETCIIKSTSSFVTIFGRKANVLPAVEPGRLY
ncbi:hypothetical protein LEP1GSC047_1640 [Leptospira inadai serovar Lyme str. 10]|uniref:Uncharacterized protein n=1 Tax=Leptospira inadai serovar Lyme str. 10 TaxID=1049790 RepID=V6H9V3_9LEPT|nr:hypothetical protein LEP1GSC047_1640 [Leptospira inadai serovar Lyme str. 10]